MGYNAIRLLDISIHAPREGSDLTRSLFAKNHGKFQSTLPVRGATHLKSISQAFFWISIHAPREGSDFKRG